MKKSLLSLFVICAAFTGCTDDSDNSGEPRLSVECYSRASEYTEETQVRDFAMYVTEYDGYYGELPSPIHVTWGGSTWNYPSLPLTEKSVSLVAFYPYSDSGVVNSVPMNLVTQTDYLASATYTVSNENPKVKFTMDHLLSCIQVNVDNSSDVTIKALDIPLEASYDVNTHALNIKSTKGYVSTYSQLLLFPETRVISFEIVCSSKTYHYVTPEIKFQKGKKYTFNLSIDTDENLRLVGDVDVAPWASGADYDDVVKN